MTTYSANSFTQFINVVQRGIRTWQGRITEYICSQHRKMTVSKERLTRKEKFAQQRLESQKEKRMAVGADSSKRLGLLLGLILAFIAFILYANTLKHEFILDDSNAVTENHIVRQGISGIPELLKTDYRRSEEHTSELQSPYVIS